MDEIKIDKGYYNSGKLSYEVPTLNDMQNGIYMDWYTDGIREEIIECLKDNYHGPRIKFKYEKTIRR